MGCCGTGSEGQPDEGTLLNQLCSVLKDYEGLEEIDKMLGIPTLAGQVSSFKPLYAKHITCFGVLVNNMWSTFHHSTGSSARPGPVPGLLGPSSWHEASSLQSTLCRSGKLWWHASWWWLSRPIYGKPHGGSENAAHMLSPNDENAWRCRAEAGWHTTRGA